MTIKSIVEILQGSIPFHSEVTIQGWIRTRRDSKAGMSFLTIYDGSCFNSIQVVINNTLPNYQNDILHLTTGCSVSLTGYVVKSLGSNQKYELLGQKIKVLGWIDNPKSYPIAAKHHSIEYLREVAHLRPRTQLIGAVARVRHTLAQAIHRFMYEQKFFWVSTPLITIADTEGVGKMFRVSTLDLENLPRTLDGNINYDKDFFGQEAFLTVSGQLNAETYACALSKIYTFGPTFRAENSNTSRHLAEFWMVEPEIAFANLNDATSLAEAMLKYIFKIILTERADDMEFFAKKIYKEAINRLINFINVELIHIEYTEAVKILQNCGQIFKNQVFWGIDLALEHERYLTEEYVKGPIVIKNYPKDNKAFYMRMNNDGKTVAAMDILMPSIGEIIGGSQREERISQIDQRLIDAGLDKKKYWWYRDLRRYGTVPHSGFGLGFERLVLYITGLQNIRDVIPFPRTPRNAKF